jgi:hypothetical protein
MASGSPVTINLNFNPKITSAGHDLQDVSGGADDGAGPGGANDGAGPGGSGDARPGATDNTSSKAACRCKGKPNQSAAYRKRPLCKNPSTCAKYAPKKPLPRRGARPPPRTSRYAEISGYATSPAYLEKTDVPLLGFALVALLIITLHV